MKAVPLSLITRLEEFERDTIERCNGEDVVQYRGALMPLVYMHERDSGARRQRAARAGVHRGGQARRARHRSRSWILSRSGSTSS